MTQIQVETVAAREADLERSEAVATWLRETMLSPFGQEFWSSLESVVTIVAILVAGAWTYLLFVRKRMGKPRLDIELYVDIVPLKDAACLLQLRVVAMNKGEVIVRPKYMRVWVQQILPLSEADLPNLEEYDPLEKNAPLEIPWPMIAEREVEYGEGDVEIEPSETDEFVFDLVIPAGVTDLQVYAYVKNDSKKSEIGWSRTTRFRHAVDDGPEPVTRIGPPIERGHNMSTSRHQVSQRNEHDKKQQVPKPPPPRLDEQKRPKPSPPVRKEGAR